MFEGRDWAAHQAWAEKSARLSTHEAFGPLPIRDGERRADLRQLADHVFRAVPLEMIAGELAWLKENGAAGLARDLSAALTTGSATLAWNAHGDVGGVPRLAHRLRRLKAAKIPAERSYLEELRLLAVARCEVALARVLVRIGHVTELRPKPQNAPIDAYLSGMAVLGQA